MLAYEIFPLISDLRWGIGGSLLLFHLGLHSEPRDLDIICTLEEFEEINKRLSTIFGDPIPASHPSYMSIRFSRFRAKADASVDLIAGVRVLAADGQLMGWDFNPRTVTYADGLPWMRPNDWVDLYAMFNRPEQAALLAQYLSRRRG